MNNRLEERLILGFLRDSWIVERDRLQKENGDPEVIARLDQEIEALRELRERHDTGEELPMQSITGGLIVTADRL